MNSNFLRTGRYGRSEGGTYNRIVEGAWWSGVKKSINAYYLSINPTTASPQYLNYRGAGFAIRCVVREG